MFYPSICKWLIIWLKFRLKNFIARGWKFYDNDFQLETTHILAYITYRSIYSHFVCLKKKYISEFSYCTEFGKGNSEGFTKNMVNITVTNFELFDLKLSVNSLFYCLERGRQCCFGRNCFNSMALNRSIRSVHMGSHNHGIHSNVRIRICMDIRIRNLHIHTKHRD